MYHITAVVIDTFHTSADGKTGCGGCQKQDHILAADCRHQIVSEQHLVVDVEFRCYYIYGLMHVLVGETALFQFFCQM